MRLGNCINLTPNGTVVHVVPCAGAHDAEVFGTFQLGGTYLARGDGGPAEGRVRLRRPAHRIPEPAARRANLAQSYVYPGQQAWDTGERTVVCEVRATSGKLTGSVRSGV